LKSSFFRGLLEGKLTAQLAQTPDFKGNPERKVSSDLRSAGSLEDPVEAYIDHGLKHPREYALYFAEPRLRPAESRTVEIGPGFVWAQAKCAERFGGLPEDYAQLVLALWALAHGTLSFLNTKLLPPQRAAELRAACRHAVAVLLRNAEQGRKED
jgi:hypothetical protein